MDGWICCEDGGVCHFEARGSLALGAQRRKRDECQEPSACSLGALGCTLHSPGRLHVQEWLQHSPWRPSAPGTAPEETAGSVQPVSPCRSGLTPVHSVLRSQGGEHVVSPFWPRCPGLTHSRHAAAPSPPLRQAERTAPMVLATRRSWPPDGLR